MTKLYRFIIEFCMPWDESPNCQRIFGCNAPTFEDAIKRLKSDWPDAIVDSITNTGEVRFV